MNPKTYPNPFSRLNTIAIAAKQAIKAQDASNLSGVLCAWREVLADLRDIAQLYDIKQPWCDRHPVNVLFLSKVSSLMGTGTTADDEFSLVYSRCKELAAYEPMDPRVHGGLSAGRALDLISPDIRSGGILGDGMTLASFSEIDYDGRARAGTKLQAAREEAADRNAAQFGTHPSWYGG